MAFSSVNWTAIVQDSLDNCNALQSLGRSCEDGDTNVDTNIDDQGAGAAVGAGAAGASVVGA